MCFGVSNEIVLLCSFLKRTNDDNYEIYLLIIKLVTQSASQPLLYRLWGTLCIFFILGYLSYWIYGFAHIFSQSLACYFVCLFFVCFVLFFSFLMASFEAQKFLIVIKFNISFFLPNLMIFVLNTLCLTKGHKDFLQCFFTEHLGFSPHVQFYV